MEKKYEKKDLFKYFWIFLICSIIGALYEEIIYVVEYYIENHAFDYSVRRGVFWGPISPVYGFGGVFLAWLLVRKKKGLFVTFIEASLAGGVVEYVLSFLQELATGTRSWDYSTKFLNINGRTTVPYMLFWGVLGILFVKLVYPIINKFLKLIQRKFYKALTITLFVIVFWDIAITWSALGRKEFRQRGLEPYTIVGKFYDEYFDDEYIKKKFPNMEEK